MRILVSLNLGGNQLPQVPTGVDSLSILTSLSLEKNKLKTLPDSLGKCTSLTYLDVSQNELNWLPDSLKNLKSLMTPKVISFAATLFIYLLRVFCLEHVDLHSEHRAQFLSLLAVDC